jgi:L-arabinose isomerase
VRRRHRLDAHLLAGPDVDRRASRRCSKPLLHLHTQFNRDLPWAEIDMDFMNLNQAAHGDREFGYMRDAAGPGAQDRRRPLAGPGVQSGSGVDPGRLRLARGAGALKVARFGDNMRDVAVTEGDKVEAQIRFGVSVNGYGVGDLADADDAVPTRG